MDALVESRLKSLKFALDDRDRLFEGTSMTLDDRGQCEPVGWGLDGPSKRIDEDRALLEE